MTQLSLTLTPSIDLDEKIKMNWEKIHLSTIDIPSQRSSFSLVVYNENLYYFGGCDNSMFYNDFFEYSISQNEWKSLETAPRLRRSHHTANVHNNCMYILGGSRSQNYLNDLHRYDFKNKTWTKLENIPIKEGLRGHSSVIHKDCIYVFGGYNGTTFLNQLFKYDINQNKWSIVETIGQIKPRDSHSMVEYKNTLYIFGGIVMQESSMVYNEELWTLDLNELKWTPLLYTGKSIKPRAFCQCTVRKDKLYFYGGHDEDDWLDDLYQLDIKNNIMDDIESTGTYPSKRAGHKMIEMKGEMYVSGGFFVSDGTPSYFMDLFKVK